MHRRGHVIILWWEVKDKLFVTLLAFMAMAFIFRFPLLSNLHFNDIIELKGTVEICQFQNPYGCTNPQLWHNIQRSHGHQRPGRGMEIRGQSEELRTGTFSALHIPSRQDVSDAALPTLKFQHSWVWLKSVRLPLTDQRDQWFWGTRFLKVFF